MKSKEKVKYDGKMDKEVVELCDLINSLPGLETFESCCGHSSCELCIWFRVRDTDKGLFILARSCDRRYWKYGYLWKLDINVGDIASDGGLPICYCLHSGPIVGEDAYDQARDLAESIRKHLGHKNFVKLYSIKL